MNKLDYNYHTHTSRCGHAVGLDEEYVIKAIELGIKRLGFSDHIFLPGVYQTRTRGLYEWLDEYIASILSLKEKYKDKIDIIVGFEAEYLPSYLPYYRELLESKKIDYLILGQHYQEVDHMLKWYEEEDIVKYAYDLVEAMRTGLFTYICHPDHFLLSVKSWDSKCEKAARIIFEEAQRLGVPLEVNNLGLRQHRPYPSEEFFRISKEYNLKYVIGMDAHDPKNFSKENVEKEFEFLKKFDIEPIDLKIK